MIGHSVRGAQQLQPSMTFFGTKWAFESEISAPLQLVMHSNCCS